MKIEQKIFNRNDVNFNKLIDYGFKKEKKFYEYESFFMKNQFKAIIKIDYNGKVSGTVIDIENNEEFLPLRLEEHIQGSFAREVKNEYEKLLQEICNKCFVKQNFIYPQSNRISQLIYDKYGNKPEFLWEKLAPGSGVLRNSKTKKWYAAILDVDRGKIQKGESGIIEVIDLKLETSHVSEIIKQPNFYPAYHMNKKYWITIILDDSISDNKIMELITESYSFSEIK